MQNKDNLIKRKISNGVIPTKKRLDALLISHPPNVTYLSNFKGSESFLLLTKKNGNHFITDSRYTEQAQKQIKGFCIHTRKGALAKEISGLAKKYKLRRIGFESAHTSHKLAHNLKVKCKPAFIPLENTVENLRVIKNRAEIELMEKAAQISISAIKKTVTYIKPGMTELEVVGYLESCMRKLGSQQQAFASIVASGINSSMPHAISSKKKIVRNEPVVIDCGCRFNGYNSDLTRTIFLGRIDAQFTYMYNTVRQAHARAIAAVRPGVKIATIDKLARDHIREKGFGRYFAHATGHGIGLEVHEAPTITYKNTKLLKKGMVFTIEPGVYMPGKAASE